ncbi:HoxA transcriptional regulator [Halobacteriales archaeon SW_7_68_16]|nr:MAG: HoxA transcriptional regulator [Halobacteriales archaeon SW_7_68_16]
MTDDPEVLIVDDERRLADLFGAWLESERPTTVAYDGKSALEAMGESVEVALLDRRMPGMSGDEVLGRIREAGYDAQVIMIPAVDPDFDIIDMGFDDYLVKPVSRDELFDIIEDVECRAAYADSVQEYYSLVSKKALLETEKSDRELEESEEYADLSERVTELEREVDETIEGLGSHEDFVGAFQDLPGDG